MIIYIFMKIMHLHNLYNLHKYKLYNKLTYAQDLAKLQKFMQTETFQKLEESIKIAENAELTIDE